MPRTPGALDLDLVSHGRKGPSGQARLGSTAIEQIRRTVRRVPEVVVKVSGGARDVRGAKAHLGYIGRHGKLEILTDDGRELLGKGAVRDLAAEWNLELSKGQYRTPPLPGEKDRRPKLTHHIVLSMPGRTPPKAVLAAAAKFARENFALQHRYAMVLHTDQQHPHVHLVVKAEHETEPGKRLHIDKAMLRAWREQFAVCLREQGVAANASPGHVRGRGRTTRKDAIHHRLREQRRYEELPEAERRLRAPPKESSLMRSKVEAVARELRQGALSPEPGKARLLETRRAVVEAWLATAQALRREGQGELAREVEAFVRTMPRVRTEREAIAAGLIAQMQALRREQPGKGGAIDEPGHGE
jgi:hypothetical protein